jgi:hypothetical protein
MESQDSGLHAVLPAVLPIAAASCNPEQRFIPTAIFTSSLHISPLSSFVSYFVPFGSSNPEFDPNRPVHNVFGDVGVPPILWITNPDKNLLHPRTKLRAEATGLFLLTELLRIFHSSPYVSKMRIRKGGTGSQRPPIIPDRRFILVLDERLTGAFGLTRISVHCLKLSEEALPLAAGMRVLEVVALTEPILVCDLLWRPVRHHHSPLRRHR